MPTTRRSAIAEKAPCTWVQVRWKFRSGSKTPSPCPDNQIRSKLGSGLDLYANPNPGSGLWPWPWARIGLGSGAASCNAYGVNEPEVLVFIRPPPMSACCQPQLVCCVWLGGLTERHRPTARINRQSAVTNSHQSPAYGQTKLRPPSTCLIAAQLYRRMSLHQATCSKSTMSYV